MNVAAVLRIASVLSLVALASALGGCAADAPEAGLDSEEVGGSASSATLASWEGAGYTDFCWNSSCTARGRVSCEGDDWDGNVITAKYTYGSPIASIKGTASLYRVASSSSSLVGTAVLPTKTSSTWVQINPRGQFTAFAKVVTSVYSPAYGTKSVTCTTSRYAYED